MSDPVLRYVTHPEVIVDPDQPVPEWSLSDRGRTRAGAMLRHRGFPGSTAS